MQVAKGHFILSFFLNWGPLPYLVIFTKLTCQKICCQNWYLKTARCLSFHAWLLNIHHNITQGLTCGEDNCRDTYPLAPGAADCCVKGLFLMNILKHLWQVIYIYIHTYVFRWRSIPYANIFPHFLTYSGGIVTYDKSIIFSMIFITWLLLHNINWKCNSHTATRHVNKSVGSSVSRLMVCRAACRKVTPPCTYRSTCVQLHLLSVLRAGPSITWALNNL